MDHPDDSTTAAVSAQINNNSGELRKDMMDTAVKFLQNPKVQQTPLGHRKAFLAKKGLTEDEIREALSRAGDSSVNAPVDSNIVAYDPRIGLPVARPAVVWRDYATAVMFVSGTTYLLYKFVRGYVLPSWFNVPDPERERVRRLDDNINDVQNGLKFLVDSVQQTLGVVQQQQETLNRLVDQLVEKDKKATEQECAIQGLKNEITIIKSLLLNRDQFPSLPVLTSSVPFLPAWQLDSVPRQQPLVNGDHRGDAPIDKKFLLGRDDEDDAASGDGYTVSEDRFASAAGSENGEKMTPV